MLEKICIILAVNFIFYFKTLRFTYVSDDCLSARRTPEKNPFIHYFWVLEGKLKSVSYNKMAQGDSNFHLPGIDHAITIIIHSLVCVGLFLGFGANEVSFIAALLFEFNPINNQGAVWISGRGYALSALGMVWALALPNVGALFLLVATYSNSGFAMPLVLIGSNHPYLLLFMPIIWFFHVKRLKANVISKMNMECFTEDKHIHPKKLILATKTFGFYLIHAILPIKTTFYHALLESIAGSRKKHAYSLCRYFWIGAASLALMGLYILTHKWDMICFGILWWCLGIAPFLNLYRMQQELSERYCYLPNVGLMIILAQIISPFPIVVAFVIGVYATKMWFWMEAYRDDWWMIQHCCVNEPKSWFAWHIAALKRWDVQSYREAVILWVMAKNLSPKEFKLLYNIAMALVFMGNQMVEPYRSNMIREGLQILGEAEKNIPGGQEEACNKLIADFRQGKVCTLI